MLPPIPPSPEEMRRARSRVAALKERARRRRRRHRLAAGGFAAVVAAAAAAATSAWLIPSSKTSTVRVISPSTTITSPASTTVPTGTTLPGVAATRTSLLYGGPGVVVVGTAPTGEAGPPRLYLSTDAVHWANVTPPQSQAADNGSYGWFEQASFLNASTGWVTSWNPATIGGRIFQTTDGGKTWNSIPGGGHSGNAGATNLVDLISPTTAFAEDFEPTAPSMSLSITTDSGKTWKTIYKGPPPTPPNGRYQGPFEMPMTFTDTRHGFAAMGVPPAESVDPEGDFFSTSDAGLTWQRQTPPLPDSPLTCPTSVDSTRTTTACLYTLPRFFDTNHGILAAVMTQGSHAYVAFDDTSDGGQHWTRASQAPVTVTPNPTQGGVQGTATFGYPLISPASARTWWVLGWSGSTATTKITTDTGTHWTTSTAPLPLGDPTALAAVDSTHALLTIENVTANGATTQLLVTANDGRTWAKPSLPK